MTTKITAGFCILLLACSSQNPPGGESEWIQLFNGRDLSGWQAKLSGHELGDNYADTFRVEDGVLEVSYEGYPIFDGKFGHLFYEQPFSHYRLRAEYRFVGEQVIGGPGWAFRNNGLMLHCQAPESMGRDQDFPASIEVQLLGGRETGTRHTANLCTPGTHIVMNGELVTRHCVDSTSKTYRGDQWVTVEVEVRGSEIIRHIMEGETVLEYTQPQIDPNSEEARSLGSNAPHLLESGYISIQAESHPTEFRRIELLPLNR
ncbi:MAG: 3-keto-disaccharide hydrolase [Planctomycetota bacterium]|jgi:hypothetical protein